MGLIRGLLFLWFAFRCLAWRPLVTELALHTILSIVEFVHDILDFVLIIFREHSAHLISVRYRRCLLKLLNIYKFVLRLCNTGNFLLLS